MKHALQSQFSPARSAICASGLAELIVADDARADDGARHVRLTPKSVQIRRRRDGVSMRIAIPSSHYRGVAIDVRGDLAANTEIWSVSLVHADAGLAATLATSADAREARALWLRYADYLGLPRLIAKPEGGFTELGQRIGALFCKRPSRRKRGSSVKGRRPSILSRRRRGDFTRPLDTYAGEREIICYE